MNLRIKMKSYAAAPELGFAAKSISEPLGLTSSFRQRWSKIFYHLFTK